MPDIVVPRGAAVRLPAALAGAVLGLLTVADPVAAKQSPGPGASASAPEAIASPAATSPRRTEPARLPAVVGRRSSRPVAPVQGSSAGEADGPVAPGHRRAAGAQSLRPMAEQAPAAPANGTGSHRPVSPVPGGGKVWPPPPRSWAPGRTPAGPMTAAHPASGRVVSVPAPRPEPNRTLLADGPSPDTSLALLLGLDVSPHPVARVCADAGMGGIVLSVRLILGTGGCRPSKPPAVPAPVIAQPAPVIAAPSPVAPQPVPVIHQPGPGPAATGTPPSNPVAAPAALPASVPGSPVPNPPGPSRVRPPMVGHYRPKVTPAAAHVLPPHRHLLKNVMVMVIVTLVVAAFAGALFAGLR